MELTNYSLKEFNIQELNRQAKQRFFLPLPDDDIYKALQAAYMGSVNERGYECDLQSNSDLLGKMASVTQWLTSPNGRVGLLLYGTVGTGKTTMLQAICKVINYVYKPEYNELTLNDVPRKAINIIRAKDVVEAYQNERETYSRMTKVQLLAIDEFGIEAIDVKSYGNSNEPIIDLLSTRYDRQYCTLISSNLDLDQINERYGLRLKDRFKEMFKMISFNGKSFRQ